MAIEQETVIEVVVSVVGVGLFIAAIVLVGATYTEDGLTADGAYALLGVMVAFILLMAVLGYWLSGREE